MNTTIVGRYGLSALGIVSVALTSVGMMGVGDAPDPHDLPATMAAHFTTVSNNVLHAAPLGYLGALGIGAFTIGLARRLRGTDAAPRGQLVALAGGLLAGYLLTLHLVYTSLAYQVAERSADATHALFVPTILAVPAVGAVAAVLFGVAGWTAHRAKSMPTWWIAITSAGAVLTSVAIVSYRDAGFFSPDVQQQAVMNTVLVWVLLTAAALARTSTTRSTP